MHDKTKEFAREIYVATIAAHHTHGLEKGHKLNFEQVAGEAIEAALFFVKAVQNECNDRTVTKVMELNEAHKAGFLAFRQGMPLAVPEDLPEHLHRAWCYGYETASNEAAH